MQHLFDIEPFTKKHTCDYKLTIPPDQEVISKIMYFKLKAWEMIGQYPSLHASSDITIDNDYNVNSAVFEEKLSYYRKKTAFISAFKGMINGFNYIQQGQTYTIFAQVEINQKIKHTFFAFRKRSLKKDIEQPHITIVKSVPKAKFDILWPYFKSMEFKCSFYADKIRVLETLSRAAYALPMRVKTELCLKTEG